MGNTTVQSLAAQQYVPVSKTQPLLGTTDYKKAAALQASAELTNEISGNVKNYYENRAKFLEQLNNKIQAENEYEAQKMMKEVAGLNLWQTNDPYKLRQGQDKLATLFRFTQFNKLGMSIDNELYSAKKLLNQTESRLAKLQQGKEPDKASNPIYMASEFPHSGERDFLV